MLEPRERKLFLEAMQPPEGYGLDRAIGTTFTLDLMALMAVPLAFTRFGWTAEDGTPKTDPLALLEAVRRHADRIHVFCQAGQIGVPPRNRPLFAFLENSVVEVKAPLGGLFHPKIWLLRFAPTAAKDGPIRYRLLVLSRNLTFDRCWDLIVALDGTLVDRKNAFAMNHPLGDFVRELPGMAIRPDAVTPDAAKAVDEIQDELRRVQFELPPGFEDMAFRPIGHRERTPWPFAERMDRMLVVSPFVSEQFLSQIGERCNKKLVLVSRAESLEAIAPERLNAFESVSVINEAAFPETADAEPTEAASHGDEDNVQSTDNALVGLHAKLFVADAGWNAHMWLGSANATDGAFGNNVEFLLELVGKKSKCGVEAVLRGDNTGSSLNALLQKYEPAAARPTDEIEDGLRSAIEKSRQALANAGFTAAVEAGKVNRFGLVLMPSTELPLELPADVTVRCWPVTLGAGFAGTEVASYVGATKSAIARFTELSLPELTSFFAFHVIATKGKRVAEAHFALNVPLTGVPADRREALLKALLKNKAALMHYLMLLLSQAGGETGDWGDEQGPQGRGSGSGQGGAVFGAHLFEALLQALQSEPSKLDHVARLVEDLRKTPEGIELLPEGFDEIWLPILAVRKEMGL